MKSRVQLASFASLAILLAGLVACQDDSSSTPSGNSAGGAGGSSTAGGSGGSTAGTGATGGSGGSGGSTAGTGATSGSGGSTAGTGGSSGGGECDGEEKTIVDLVKAKAPLPENRVRLKGVVATSHKFLVSNSDSGCLWGVFVTSPGAEVVEYGSLQIVSKGDPPTLDSNMKKVCPTEQAKTGSIPNDIAPGDVIDVSGFIDEFLLGSCGKESTTEPGVINPKPEAGQRQFENATCIQKTGSGPVPAPKQINDVALLEAYAQGKNTDDTLYKWSNALVTITTPLTTKQVPTEKYFSCSAVTGFGDLNFNETALVANNSAYYKDMTCAGPNDSAKRYDFQQPTTFSSVTGIFSIDFCTWQLTIRSRCDDFAPKSPSCDLSAECTKAEDATKCEGSEDTAALCGDSLDNDGDGFIDCEDKGCCSLVDCKTTAPDSYCGKGGGAGGSGGGTGENTAELCGDKADNDGDNFIDCEDKSCCSVVDCKTTAPDSYCAKQGSGGSGGSGGGTGENTAALCGDKTDNDGDGFVDCNDKECCSLVDCKGEPSSYCGKQGAGGTGGSSSGGENTAALCGDKADNDGDGFIDCNDKDCCSVVDCKGEPSSYCGKQGAGGSSAGGENTAALCGDKTDNDGDGFVDCNDKDCCKLVDCTGEPNSYCGKNP